MQRHLQPAVDRFKAMADEDKREDFRRQAVRLREGLCLPEPDRPLRRPDLEMLYSYGRFLLPHLPLDRDTTIVKVGDEVALQYYRWSACSRARSIVEGRRSRSMSRARAKWEPARRQDEKAPLSEIIEVLNERFGTQFSEEDRLFFQQIKEKACKSEQVVRQRWPTRSTSSSWAFASSSRPDDRAHGRERQDRDALHGGSGVPGFSVPDPCAGDLRGCASQAGGSGRHP
jgi:type I restriction enzyme R subunit